MKVAVAPLRTHWPGTVGVSAGSGEALDNGRRKVTTIGVRPDRVAGATDSTFGSRDAAVRVADGTPDVADEPALQAEAMAASRQATAATRRARTPCIDCLSRNFV